ncbi:MAG: hypothetical protein K2G55_19890, partial [Lachnospiraceae bacterium]|nr:hypothetical protein [Lachnospiraceae bacterium]
LGHLYKRQPAMTGRCISNITTLTISSFLRHSGDRIVITMSRADLPSGMLMSHMEATTFFTSMRVTEQIPPIVCGLI